MLSVCVYESVTSGKDDIIGYGASVWLSVSAIYLDFATPVPVSDVAIN